MMTDSELKRLAQSSAGEWFAKSRRNVDRWGVQDTCTLLAVAQEELGEVAQAFLQATHERGDRGRVLAELSDLGAVLFQILESELKR